MPLAAAGDEDAFLKLWARYHRLALNVARKVCQTPADADDAAQVTFQWLLEGRWRLDPATQTHNGNLHGFVKQLAVFAAWRTLRPIEETDADEFGVAFKHRPARTRTPEQLLLAKELRLRIAEAIRALPRQYRRVAIARYYSSLGGPQIALLVNVKACTVPGYLNVIRRKLRQALADLITIPPPDGRRRGGYVRYDGDRWTRTAS